MKPYSLLLQEEEAMVAFAARVAHFVTTGMIIFLKGPLGAGKTTFARGFLRGMGFVEKVKSPTYTLVEPYVIHERTVYHFDLYRLKALSELEEMGIREYFSDESVCLIEWPEQGQGLLPTADVICELNFFEEARSVTITALSERGELLLCNINAFKR